MVTLLAESVDTARYSDASELRRSEAFPRWSGRVYGGVMPQRRSIPPRETAWMRYLKGIQDRRGWSIARVARESGGRISRATLFRMIGGETRRVPIDTVRLVAEIVGDDPEGVIKQVAGSVIEETAGDPRLHGLDPSDSIVQHILSLDIDEEERGWMLERRRQIVAQRHKQDIQEIEFWVNRRAA